MWLETITVRTRELRQLEMQLPRLLEQLASEAPELSPTVYKRFPGNSDLSFHLALPSSEAQTSDHGLRMAAALSSFGTVDHALWQSVSATPGENNHG